MNGAQVSELMPGLWLTLNSMFSPSWPLSTPRQRPSKHHVCVLSTRTTTKGKTKCATTILPGTCNLEHLSQQTKFHAIFLVIIPNGHHLVILYWTLVNVLTPVNRLSPGRSHGEAQCSGWRSRVRLVQEVNIKRSHIPLVDQSLKIAGGEARKIVQQ